MTPTYGDATATEFTMVVGSVPIAGELPSGVALDLPPVLAGKQAYYWSAKWQTDEQESMAALRAGESRAFTEPMAALLWLLDEDDD